MSASQIRHGRGGDTNVSAHRWHVPTMTGRVEALETAFHVPMATLFSVGTVELSPLQNFRDCMYVRAKSIDPPCLNALHHLAPLSYNEWSIRPPRSSIMITSGSKTKQTLPLVGA